MFDPDGTTVSCEEEEGPEDKGGKWPLRPPGSESIGGNKDQGANSDSLC